MDISKTCAPKSDQLNADDLIGGPKTITITDVRGNDGDQQPISVYFEGDNNKPYKPSKGMRRVLVHMWGKEGSEYKGRSMTIYCEPSVKFGGIAVGGIRISHMSHIEKVETMALTITRAKKTPFTVKPLKVQEAKPEPTQDKPDPSAIVDAITKATAAASGGKAEFLEWFNSDEGKALRPLFKDDAAEMKKLSAICKETDDAIAVDPFGLPPIKEEGEK